MSGLKKKVLNLRDEGSTAVQVKIFDKMTHVRKQAVKSVCKVKTALDDQGTGALYRVVDKNGKDHFTIMTCNHVLPTTSLNEIMMTIFMFEEIQQMASINLSKEHIQFVWTTKLLDATVIELSPQIASLYSSYGAQFLKVGEAELLAEVTVLQYPLGTLSIATGNIEGLGDAKVYYRMGTAPGSSGSPLLTWDCVALAMHKAGVVGTTGDQPNTIREATSLSAIVKTYLEDISEIQQQTITLKDQLDCLRCLFKVFSKGVLYILILYTRSSWVSITLLANLFNRLANHRSLRGGHSAEYFPKSGIYNNYISIIVFNYISI